VVFCTDPPTNPQAVDERMEEWYANLYHLRNCWNFHSSESSFISTCSNCKGEIEKLVEQEINFLSQEDLSHLESQAEEL
jgi:transposase